MEIQVQRSTTIAAGHPNTTVPATELPLTIFDRFASNIHIAVIFAFAAPTPANDALIDGLLKTFPHFPTLTGQLGYSPTHRRPCILIGGGGGGGGAQVVETTVSSELSDHLPLNPSPELKKLHPSSESTTQLFHVQFNRFKCGGLVIGFSVHHRVADGHSMGFFFTTWAKAVRGAAIDRLPVYDKSWLTPRRPPKCEFQHWGLDFLPIGAPQHNAKNVDPSKITNILLKYPSDYLNDLKSKVNNNYTTFETLSAHLWRKLTIARRLRDDEHTMVRVPVNGRTRLKPLVSDEFFGNLVVTAYPNANVKVLIDGGLDKAASIIHQAIVEMDEGYFQSFVDFGELNGEEELVPVFDVEGNVLSPTLEMDSWVRFRFQEMDLGCGGELRGFLPTWVPFEGLVMFLPGLGEEGGVDVFVTLLEEHVELLRQISHSFD